MLRALSTQNATNSNASVTASPAYVSLREYVNDQLLVLTVVLLVSYGIMFLFSGLLLYYMRHHRTIARKGDSDAVRKILLPSFEPLLWILCFATGAFTLYLIVSLLQNLYVDSADPFRTECFYAGRQFVMLLVIVFMLQPSVSIPALKRTVAITLALSTYSIIVGWYIATYQSRSSSISYALLQVAHGCLVMLYVYIAIRPPGRANKRSLRKYCAFALVDHAFEFSYATSFYYHHIKLGFALIYAMLIWGSLCPLFIWRVLKADTEHWRGMGQRACALQSLFRQKTNVNEHTSSEGLHLLIEMHRKFIIDFAYLELRQRIGIGATAVVYNGVLHFKTPVAVKVYTPTVVTEETVAEFSHEAALCGALNHPNIVKFYGMCVSPPTICLVSELCYGSLDMVITVVANRRQPSRQQFLINLGYMLDAARAIAYIHSFSPAFVHRDIKPGNFLVDVDGTAKLTDFGESRSLPRANITWQNGTTTENGNMEMDKTYGSNEHYHELCNQDLVFHPQPSMPSLTNKKRLQMTVKGTADYMAPEIINGKGGVALYGEAADIYSLAITMWDILNPGTEKYPNSDNNHLRIFESVLAGDRPIIDDNLHPSLRELLRDAWSMDPRQRPSAQHIVQTLENIQEEICSNFAMDLSEELENDHIVSSKSRNGQISSKTFSGACVIKKMEELEAIGSTREGVRLGNMLMDAGFLHHVKHVQCFENTNDSLYFFDDDNIRLCHPFAMLEPGDCQPPSPPPISPDWHGYGSKQSKSESNARANSSSRSHLGSDGAMSEIVGSHTIDSTVKGCACQKLGQRLEGRKTLKQRFRRKHKVTSEVNILTANLLQQDEHMGAFNSSVWDDFTDTPSRSVPATLL